MRRRSRVAGPPARVRLRISGSAPPTPRFATNLLEKPETRFRKALADSLQSRRIYFAWTDSEVDRRRGSAQKKKVPSDPSLSLAPRRHARHEAAQSRAPDVSPLRSPTGAFFAGWINASRHAAAFLASLSWDRLLGTAFHSPATKPAFASPIPGSTFPACSFASFTSVPKPVRLFAPLPVHSSPRSGSFFALARCSFPAVIDPPAHGLRSPSGLLPPSGSKRSTAL
jgi:hypothetical protein